MPSTPASIMSVKKARTDLESTPSNRVVLVVTRNPRFTAVERSLGVAGLAKAADEFAGPSYSCSKTNTATEQAICGSEVLRILDAQIARAFSALRRKAGPAIAEEQRHWLQSRDRSCPADVDCLAEMMRTHLRALQERINE